MVNIIENFIIAVENVKRQKIRSFLTILAIVVGMGAVVMFVTLGVGVQTGINEQFEILGTNKIFITPGASLYSFGGTSKLTDDDLKVIEDVNGVDKVSYMIFGIARVEYKDELVYSWVSGIPKEGLDLFESGVGWGMESGRYPKDGSTDEVALGWRYLQGEIFEEKIELGDKIDIEGKEYKIVGSFSQVGNSQDDSTVMLSFDAAGDLLGKEDEYDNIMVSTSKGTNTTLVAEKIKKELRDSRNLDVGEEDFSVKTTGDLITTFNSIIGIIFVAIIGISSISLLVGSVGIMNTMYTAVLDRTREIGVLKAIGATNEDIALIFVIESGVLGLIGGAIGVAVGIGLSYILQFIAVNILLSTLVKIYLSPALIIGILVFSFLVGCLAGFLPARRASKMKPTDALRYE